MTARADGLRANSVPQIAVEGVARFAAPTILFVLALLARFAASGFVTFPLSEGSAYYVGVAHNLATGHGLVTDSLWSYASPPLTLPRPAFELWQPLASLIAAVPMIVLPPTFSTAQLAFAFVGALLAPLTWLIARDAATRLNLPHERIGTVAIAAGLLAAVGGPFVLSAALPDSTLPFTVIAVAACALMARATGGERWPLLGLGVLAGLAYLARMEAIYLAVAFLAVGRASGVAWTKLAWRGSMTAAIAAIVALPWWIRNLVVFGTPLPGQIVDNLFLVRNEQIYSFAERPNVSDFLSQGPAVLLANIGGAAWHNFVEVLLLAGAGFTFVGVLALAVGFRRRQPLAASALAALIVLGLTTFLLTTLLFPVATLWGTFEHASGPLMVGLAVAAALGADAAVARIARWRHWPRSNAWLAPAALLALAIPLSALQLTFATLYSQAQDQQVSDAARAVAEASPAAMRGPFITDHPIWLAEATGSSALALPDEPADSLLQLARRFGASAVIIIDGRGRYPDELRGPAARSCFGEVPVARPSSAPDLSMFIIDESCK